MAISFNEIPLATYVPGVYAEFDGSQAGTGVAAQPHESIMLGQKLSTGTAVEGTVYPIRSADQAIGLFGQHSQLAQMCAAYKGKDKITPLWAVALADAGAAVAADGEFALTGTATAAGAMVLYIGGRRVSIPVAVGDTAADLETAGVAAINALTDCPVTAAPDGVTDAIDVTARHAGTIGNQILLGHSLRDGEALPAGISVAITPMASGATDPDYDTLVASLGEDQYHTAVAGIRTVAEVNKLITEFESRFAAPRMIEGVVFVAAQDSQTDLSTLGNGYNSEIVSLVVCEESALCRLPWEIAARVAALNARQVQADPALNGIGGDLGADYPAAPRGTARFTWSERNTLLTDGCSTLKAGSDGRQLVEWLQTTYQTNALSIADTAFRDLYKVRLLSYLRYTWRTRMGTKFANAKLADNGNEVPGQLILTPDVGKAETLEWFREHQRLGQVENYDQFAEELVVERNASDDNRMDFLLPPDLINNVVVQAGKFSFRG